MDIDQGLIQKICTGQKRTASSKNIFYRFSYKKINKLEPLEEIKRNRKKVYQYDINNNLIATYNSISDAIKLVPCSRHIYEALNENKLFKGYYWRTN